MNQRLGIAGALLGDPETLMFDEPINGLDPEGILWIRNLMKSLASEGRTVLPLEPPHERDGPDRRSPARDRPGAASSPMPAPTSSSTATRPRASGSGRCSRAS